MARLLIEMAIAMDSTDVDPQDVADALLLNEHGGCKTFDGQPVIWFQAGWLPPQEDEGDDVLLEVTDGDEG